MYLLLFFLVPVLYLFNPRLAMAGLAVAVVFTYVQRTRSVVHKRARRALESSAYKAGYEE